MGYSLRVTHYDLPSMRIALIHFFIIALIVLTLVFGPLAPFAQYLEVYLGGNRHDGAIYLWLMRERAWDLASMQGGMYYPYSLSAAYSDNFILPAFFYRLVKSFFSSFSWASDPLIYNTIILSGLVSGAYATALLAYQLSKRREIALLCALLVVCLPYFVGQIGHPQLLGIFPFPFAYICYRKFVHHRGWQATVFGGGIGLLVLASFYWSVYYSIFLVLAIALLLLRAVLRREISLVKLLQLIFANLPWALALLLSAQAYLQVQQRFGVRTLRQVRGLSSGAMSILSPSHANSLWGAWFGQASNFENQNFPGMVFLLLLVLAFFLVSSSRKRCVALLGVSVCLALVLDYSGVLSRTMSAYWYWCPFVAAMYVFIRSEFESVEFFLGLAIVFFVLSWGAPVSKEAYSPFAVAFSIIPGVSSIRAPSRLIVLFYFFSLAAVAVASTRLEWQRHRIFKSVALLGLIAFLVFESRARYVYSPMGPDAPEIYTVLGTMTQASAGAAGVIPKRGREVAVSLPIEARAGARNYTYSQSQFMLWLQSAAARYINGYSGMASKWNTLFPWRMRYFPSEKSLKVLGMVPEVRWIVYHPQPTDRDDILEKINQFPDRLQLRASDVSGNLLIEFTPAYSEGIHQLRVENLGKNVSQNIRLGLVLSEFSPATDVTAVLDCSKSQGRVVEAVLKRQNRPVEGVVEVSCTIPAPENLVSSRLFDLRINARRQGAKVYIQRLLNSPK